MPKTTVEEVAQAARERFVQHFMTDDVVFSTAVSQLAEAIAKHRGIDLPAQPQGLNEEEYCAWLDEEWTSEMQDRWSECEWDAVRLIMQPLLEISIPADMEIELTPGTRLGDAIADL